MAATPVGLILKQYPFFRDFVHGKEDEETFTENMREFHDELSRQGVSEKELAALIESMSPKKQHEIYESFRRNSGIVDGAIKGGDRDKVFKIAIVLLMLYKKLSQAAGMPSQQPFRAHARAFLVRLFRLLRESNYSKRRLNILEKGFFNIDGLGQSPLPQDLAV